MSKIFPSKEKKELLVNLLLAMGCTRVQVHFAGGGDSGSIEDVYVLDKDGSQIGISNVELEWEEESSVFNEHLNQWGKKFETKMMSLDEILREITNQALEESGHDWYNNDGGQGDFNIYPTETPVRIELEIGINYMETTNHLHEYTDEEESEEEDAPISPQ